MNPSQIFKMLLASVPTMCRDEEGRKALRSVVNLLEGLIYQMHSPYGQQLNPQLHEALAMFQTNLPQGEARVLEVVDELKRQLSAYDDHDGVITFSQPRLS